MKPIKPCKTCGLKPKYANSNFCWGCLKAREKTIKEEKAFLKKERHESTKGFKESLRKTLHKKAWKLMSEIVRRTGANLDGYNECYTCGAVKRYTEMNAGHYKHDRLDFDFRNVRCQCVKCNQHNSGELDLYAERLIRENGLEWFNKLVQDSWRHKGYSVEDLVAIIEDLKIKLENLK
ncbi:MAG: recombination protein NinG [Candidatus Omnitrophota bacterium]